ncbi:MAG: hypothetical protein ACM32E_23990 [Gemmatimonadota bacterium]
MSGSLLAIIVIPIVVFLALFGWLAAVLYANRHPGGREPGARPRWHVTGGAFQGDPRQLMPHRDAVPPEAAAYEGSGDEEP